MYVWDPLIIRHNFLLVTILEKPIPNIALEHVFEDPSPLGHQSHTSNSKGAQITKSYMNIKHSWFHSSHAAPIGFMVYSSQRASLHCLEALKLNGNSTMMSNLHAMSGHLEDIFRWKNERYICVQLLFPLTRGARNILSLLYTRDSILHTWLNRAHGQEGFVVYERTFMHAC